MGKWKVLVGVIIVLIVAGGVYYKSNASPVFGVSREVYEDSKEWVNCLGFDESRIDKNKSIYAEEVYSASAVDGTNIATNGGNFLDQEKNKVDKRWLDKLKEIKENTLYRNDSLYIDVGKIIFVVLEDRSRLSMTLGRRGGYNHDVIVEELKKKYELGFLPSNTSFFNDYYNVFIANNLDVNKCEETMREGIDVINSDNINEIKEFIEKNQDKLERFDEFENKINEIYNLDLVILTEEERGKIYEWMENNQEEDLSRGARDMALDIVKNR